MIFAKHSLTNFLSRMFLASGVEGGGSVQLQFSSYILEPLLHLLVSLLLLRLRSSPALCDLSDGILPAELRQHLLHSENKDIINKNEQATRDRQNAQATVQGWGDGDYDSDMAIPASPVKAPSNSVLASIPPLSPDENERVPEAVDAREEALQVETDVGRAVQNAHDSPASGAGAKGTGSSPPPAKPAQETREKSENGGRDSGKHTCSYVEHVLRELNEFYKTGMCGIENKGTFLKWPFHECDKCESILYVMLCLCKRCVFFS